MKLKQTTITKQLTTPGLYEAQIDLLYQQQLKFSGQKDKQAISIQTINLHQEQVARLITQQMKKQSYQPHQVQERVIRVGDKDRVICKLDVFDHIVQGALSRLIMPRLQDYLSKHLYSYQGRSNFLAAKAFSHFVKQAHHQQRLDLFVIRTDVKSYTDSIPINDNAPIWSKLADLLDYLNIEPSYTAYLFQLMKQFLRPIMLTDTGVCYQRTIGLPMGSPLCAILSLIYLNQLDKELLQQQNAFYARFGDDILIAHSDYTTISRLNQQLKQGLTELGLSTNPSKHQIVYLTRCGRQYAKDNSLKHSQKITYLGLDILANGTIELKKEATRVFLKDIMQRIRNLTLLYQHTPLQQQGRLICQAINQSLIPQQPLANEKISIYLGVITSRKQLQALDYLIARKIAESLCGLSGARAFRHVPYKKIRKEFGLKSLCQLRNQGRNHASAHQLG